MKHNWEYKKLGEVCVPKSGLGRASAFFTADDEISYIDISSIDNNLHRVNIPTVIAFGLAPSRAQQILKSNDVIVSLVRPNLKNIAILNLDVPNMVGSSGFCVLRAKGIYPKYIFYYVLSSHFTKYLISHASGASYPAVTDNDVRNAIIPIPLAHEQEKIIAELDEINSVIEAKREQIKQLDLLAQSLFYTMFGDPVTNPMGWNVTELRDACTDIVDGDHSAPPKSLTGVPFITISNIDKIRNKIDFSDSFYVPQNYFDALKGNRKPQDGDVLYTVTGSYGITVLVQGGKISAFNDTSGYCGPRTDMLNSTYLAHWGRSDSIKVYADNVATGIAQKTVSLNSLRTFPIILPPLELQREFAAKVEAIEARKGEIEESVRELQTLLDSRMDYWFN